MIQQTQGDFVLTYDPVTDTAQLTCAGVLVADYKGAHCYVRHGGGWLEFEHRARRDGERKSHALHRLRALLGKADDVFSRLERIVVWNEIRSWDKLMKHGIWKCKDSSCKHCKPHSSMTSFFVANTRRHGLQI